MRYLPIFILYTLLFPIQKSIAQILPTDSIKMAVNANIPTNSTILWRGFWHKWTYNHRLNRLGDAIINQQLINNNNTHQATLFHAGATGTGSDIGISESHYTYLNLPANIHVQHATITFNISGKEGEMQQETQKQLITALPILKNQEQYVAVINGFDIVSEKKADKLQVIDISIGTPEYLPATQQIQTNINLALLLKCGSIECSQFSNRVNYTVTIQYVIFAAPTAWLHATEKNTAVLQQWDTEIDPAKQQNSTLCHLQGIPSSEFENAALGFKSIRFYLNRDHWITAWKSAIYPQKYEPKTGVFDYTLDLFFQQWENDMKKNSAYKKHSKFAIKKGGWGLCEATVQMLQFKTAQTYHTHTNNINKWEGGNQPANVNKSLINSNLEFEINNFEYSVKNDLNRLYNTQKNDNNLKEQYKAYKEDLHKNKK